MAEITVKTNNVPRHIIDAWELTPTERAEFDYLNWPAIEEGNDSASFVRYRGILYDLGEFMEGPPPGTPGKWHRYQSDSFFSGILVRYLGDNDDGIIVGLLLA